MERSALRALILRKVAAGALPDRPLKKIWGGPAVRAETCAACDEPIAGFVIEGLSTAGTTSWFHVECFFVWDAEREPAPSEERFPLVVATPEDLIDRLLHEHRDWRFCYPCVSARLDLPDDAVAAAVVHLRDRAACDVRPARCSGCGRQRLTLMAR
jgi:hypothetical protein